MDCGTAFCTVIHNKNIQQNGTAPIMVLSRSVGDSVIKTIFDRSFIHVLITINKVV